MYAKYIKRPFDFVLSLLALLVLSPVFVILIILGAIMMKGNPFFTQLRPGKGEKIFRLIKFRTMNCEKDEDGNLLPDDVRLTKYGKFLRSTSLDELPELFNILKGDMAIIGPRPQLVRDMVFMSDTQRLRHTVRPGLSGLAQINGRNAIKWDNKLAYDLEYIENITFLGDVKIIILTFLKIFKSEGITDGENVTALDYGDELLKYNVINTDEYTQKQKFAEEIIRKIEVH